MVQENICWILLKSTTSLIQLVVMKLINLLVCSLVGWTRALRESVSVLKGSDFYFQSHTGMWPRTTKPVWRVGRGREPWEQSEAGGVNDNGRLPYTKHKLKSRPGPLSSFTVITPPFILPKLPPWDSRPMSGAGVVHYHLLHRPHSVPTALGSAPPHSSQPVIRVNFFLIEISVPSE